MNGTHPHSPPDGVVRARHADSLGTGALISALKKVLRGVQAVCYALLVGEAPANTFHIFKESTP